MKFEVGVFVFDVELGIVGQLPGCVLLITYFLQPSRLIRRFQGNVPVQLMDILKDSNMTKQVFFLRKFLHVVLSLVDILF